MTVYRARKNEKNTQVLVSIIHIKIEVYREKFVILIILFFFCCCSQSNLNWMYSSVFFVSLSLSLFFFSTLLGEQKEIIELLQRYAFLRKKVSNKLATYLLTIR